MTVLNLSTQVPSDIDTVEKILAWSGYALAFVNPDIGVLEVPNRSERVAQASIFQAADNSYRILIRACLPLNPNYMSDRSVKIWQHTQQVTNTVLPVAFTTN